ncbi:GAF domain-containing protein [Pseudanabaena biceps]|nr:GAF domain-containing protein [Pseudanabaena biceps]
MFNRQAIALILLIIAGFVGNYCRWTLFFDIDFIFGSIAVWIVVCLYGVRWGTFAGFIAGYCTYVIWHHPYTTITFTIEALFVGWLFHRRQQDNIVLLDGLFWLLIGMPLIWLFYGVILGIDQTQVLIILMKQPVNGIFNALMASLMLTHLPIHDWLKRPPAISTLSLQQTLFNLLVLFVSVPTLLLIVLASNQVIDDIKNTVRLDLNDASRYLTVEVQGWYERRLVALSGLAELASTKPIQDNLIRQRVSFMRLNFPDFKNIYILDETGANIFNFNSDNTIVESIFNQNDYFEQLKRSPQFILSPVILQPNKSNFPIALLSIPIQLDGKLVGAILSEIDLSKITSLFQTNLNEENLGILLLDQQQTVASSTKSELIGTRKFNWRKDGKITQIDTQSYHLLPVKISYLVMVQWQKSQFVKEFKLNANFPWTMVVQIAATPYVQQIERIHTRNMAILILVSGLALILATLVSRQLTKPLLQLAAITTDLPNKLLDQEPVNWLRSSVTELVLLIKNFRAMSSSLQQKFREINQANELLELRVQERTQALSEQNKRIEIFAEVTLKIRQSIELREILNRAVIEIHKILQTDRAFIYQINLDLTGKVVEESGVLSYPALIGSQIFDPCFPACINDYIQGRISVVNDIDNSDLKHCYITFLKQFDVKANIVVPILQVDQLWGLLVVHQCDRPRQWLLFEIEFLLQLANQLSIAIFQSELVINLRKNEQSLQNLNEQLENRVAQRTADLELANKDLESFSYSVSHDLRAPLRAIHGFSKILQEDYADCLDAEGDRYLNIVRDNARRMSELIDDLLNLSRMQRQEISRQSIVVDDLIKQVLCGFESEISDRQIEFIIADLPNCEADLSLLTQVWINLISNGIKYTSKAENAQIEIGCQVIDNKNTYFVRDNGVGFDMQYADKLFGVFQRMHLERDFEGTGIGLAIVKRIVQRHGGNLWANAAVNQGATFFFTIPNK